MPARSAVHPSAVQTLNSSCLLAQIFTTLVLTQDRLIVAGNVIQGTANSVLLWQTASTAASSAGAVSKQQGRLSADDDDEVWLATSGTAIPS